MPGRDPGGLVMTTVVGICGLILAGVSGTSQESCV
jgi:hypothetical protein